jgi:hypothetical protein
MKARLGLAELQGSPQPASNCPAGLVRVGSLVVVWMFFQRLWESYKRRLNRLGQWPIQMSLSDTQTTILVFLAIILFFFGEAFLD